MQSRLVLASQSPRRADLLRKAGFRFSVAAASDPELMTESLSVRELTLINAVRKGRFVLRKAQAGITVLAADTLVALDGKILGKPTDLAEARDMLRHLSARTHAVYTSVFIAQDGGKHVAFSERTDVTFVRLSEKMISRYFEGVNPLDKAGAYAAQADGATIIQQIKGSRSNVIGLPMETTAKALAAFGIRASS